MNSASDLKQFLDAARNQGASDETLAALLRGREWPEEDVYRVLADHFESRTPAIHVPSYKRSSSAKDAFLYLCFSTLAMWTLGPRLNPLHPHRALVPRSARSMYYYRVLTTRWPTRSLA